MARIKDFLPYANKIQASGAQAVLTGNWGNDLTLLVHLRVKNIAIFLFSLRNKACHTSSHLFLLRKP